MKLVSLLRIGWDGWSRLKARNTRRHQFAETTRGRALVTLPTLSIKLLYLAFTAHCLLSCRPVRWTRACGFSTFSAWSCDFWSLPLSAWINSTKRGKIPYFELRSGFVKSSDHRSQISFSEKPSLLTFMEMSFLMRDFERPLVMPIRELQGLLNVR